MENMGTQNSPEGKRVTEEEVQGDGNRMNRRNNAILISKCCPCPAGCRKEGKKERRKVYAVDL